VEIRCAQKKKYLWAHQGRSDKADTLQTNRPVQVDRKILGMWNDAQVSFLGKLPVKKNITLAGKSIYLHGSSFEPCATNFCIRYLRPKTAASHRERPEKSRRKKRFSQYLNRSHSYIGLFLKGYYLLQLPKRFLR